MTFRKSAARQAGWSRGRGVGVDIYIYAGRVPYWNLQSLPQEVSVAVIQLEYMSLYPGAPELMPTGACVQVAGTSARVDGRQVS